MKKLCHILMVLPLIISTIALYFLPSSIPAHYDISNQVDRWGSKYELLILPILAVVTGMILLAMVHAGKKEDEKNNLIATMVILGSFNVVTCIMIYTSAVRAESLSIAGIHLEQVIFSILGMFMLVIGDLLPRTKRNQWLGLRTKTTLSSDERWTKAQQFAGITTVVCGIGMIVAGLCLTNIKLYITVTSLLVITCIVDVCYVQHLKSTSCE